MNQGRQKYEMVVRNTFVIGGSSNSYGGTADRFVRTFVQAGQPV